MSVGEGEKGGLKKMGKAVSLQGGLTSFPHPSFFFRRRFIHGEGMQTLV